MSGCPNGCSQHHIANIGFYGASIKVGDRTVPAYIAHVGGNYERGEIVFGQRLKSRLPAKRVPEAVERWMRLTTSPSATTARVQRVRRPRRHRLTSRSSSSELTMPIEFNLENMDHFIDWSRSEPYKVERGEGECAV